MSFADDMRTVATDLITEFGNSCTLTKNNGPAIYNPLTGTTAFTSSDIYQTFSAQKSKVNLTFGENGQNTNLAAFNNESVMVPWFGETIDSTWLYNDANIKTVNEVRAQDKVIIFELTIGEKK